MEDSEEPGYVRENKKECIYYKQTISAERFPLLVEQIIGMSNIRQDEKDEIINEILDSVGKANVKKYWMYIERTSPEYAVLKKSMQGEQKKKHTKVIGNDRAIPANSCDWVSLADNLQKLFDAMNEMSGEFCHKISFQLINYNAEGKRETISNGYEYVIEDFCYGYETTTEDVMIILGDAGINYWLDLSDKELKGRLSGMDITFFCVHGNHEARPWEAADYEEKIWNEGIVYVEEQYPNILFAKDGEIYNFHGKKVMPIGGAYSVDKYYRIRNGLPWFESEQPDEMIKEYVEQQLDKAKWNVDIVLSHTVPIEAEPVWAFIPGLDQSVVDKSTEKWLQKIYDRLDFTEWYAGHYHVESEECGIRIMYEDYDEICAEE